MDVSVSLSRSLYLCVGKISKKASRRIHVIVRINPIIMMRVCMLSHALLFETPWTAAHHAPPSMGFSRQEHWSGLPCPPQGNLSDPGIKPPSPALAGRFLTTGPQGKPTLQNRSRRVIPDCHSDCGKSPKARTSGEQRRPSLASRHWRGQAPVPGHSEPL